MRRWGLVHLTPCLGTLAALLLAGPALAAEPPNPAEVESLIRQLGSNDLAAREEAARRLEAAGDAVIVALRRVGASPGDPDLRLRALVLARKIESAAYG